MSSLTTRLQRLEVKVDACLVLLRELTTADDFVYKLSDRSRRWRDVMEWAERVAGRTIDSLATSRQASELGEPLADFSQARKLPSGTVPTCLGASRFSEEASETISDQ